MSEIHEIEKWVWTEADFERMGWHDVAVYAFAYQAQNWEFLLDLDYILQWVDPLEGELGYQFTTAPATLVFADVGSIRIDLEPLSGFEIENISRSDPQTRALPDGTSSKVHWLWTIDFQEGEITFRSTGYAQYIRRNPILSTRQSLTAAERGGLSFERGRLA